MYADCVWVGVSWRNRFVVIVAGVHCTCKGESGGWDICWFCGSVTCITYYSRQYVIQEAEVYNFIEVLLCLITKNRSFSIILRSSSITTRISHLPFTEQWDRIQTVSVQGCLQSATGFWHYKLSLSDPSWNIHYWHKLFLLTELNLNENRVGTYSLCKFWQFCGAALLYVKYVYLYNLWNMRLHLL